MPTKEQLDLLADSPPNATRVKVVTAEGKEKWRILPGLVGPEEQVLLDTDTIALSSKKRRPIFMTGKPGRKVRPKRHPKDELVKVIVKDKEEHMKKDPLLAAVRENPESVEVLHETIKAIANEVSSLEFERIEADRKGEGSAMLSNRRIAALTKIGDTWLKRMDQIMSKGIDLESPAFKGVYNLIMETFREAMSSANIREEAIKLTFTKFSHRVEADDWWNEARMRMKQ